jgi:hypothetical protein
MLNYTTTTIVNDGNSVYANATEKLFRVKFGPELYNDGTIHKACLVKKTAYTAPVKATATVELPTTDGIYRIAMYIRLRNNNNPYFSNDWTFKGKPLYIEFAGSDTAATIVTRAKKYMLAQYGYNLVDFSATAGTPASGDDPAVPGKLVITAHDQWEMFMDQDNGKGVIVETLKTVDMAGNVIAAGATANSPTHEEFVVEAANNTDAKVAINNGNEGFGDFAHIVKDLRLPTAANRRWQGIAEGDVFGNEPNDDKPLPTGHYTQYTIQYDSERGVLQQTALGGVATSRTVHVFYVEAGAITDFEKALNTSTIGTTEVAGKLI